MTPTAYFHRLYGHGWQIKVAAALGLSPRTLRKWGDDWPEYALAHVEWLDETPEKYWTERWQR